LKVVPLNWFSDRSHPECSLSELWLPRSEKPDHDADVARTDLKFCKHQFCCIQQAALPQHLEGMFFTVFIIAVAAAEASVAIAIIINIYRRLVSIDVEKMEEMKICNFSLLPCASPQTGAGDGVGANKRF